MHEEAHQEGAKVEEDAANTSLVNLSKSRLRVLKALEDHRRTASELARDLELTRSTVHGYLQDLVDEGFVERYDDEERLWVYYDLSEKGDAFVSGERLTLVVDLATLSSFLGAASIGLFRFLVPPEPSGGGMSIRGGPEPSPSQGPPWLMIAYVSLVLLTLAGWGLHLYLNRRRARQPRG